MTEVLVSPGFGAGFSTWAHDKKYEIATYQPLIDYVKSGKPLSSIYDGNHPLVEQMKQDLGLDHLCLLGTLELEVQIAEGPFYIEENDGSETLRTAKDFWSPENS